MILVPKKKWGVKKFQRGVLHPIGFWGLTPATVELSGTSSVPNNNNTAVPSGSDARAGWRFNVDGTVDKINGSPTSPTYTQFNNTPAEWMSDGLNPDKDYWLRFALTEFDTPTFDTGVLGVTWNPISGSGEALALFYYDQLVVGQTGGTIRVQISETAAFGGLVATGYYKSIATVNI